MQHHSNNATSSWWMNRYKHTLSFSSQPGREERAAPVATWTFLARIGVRDAVVRRCVISTYGLVIGLGHNAIIIAQRSGVLAPLAPTHLLGNTHRGGPRGLHQRPSKLGHPPTDHQALATSSTSRVLLVPDLQLCTASFVHDGFVVLREPTQDGRMHTSPGNTARSPAGPARSPGTVREEPGGARDGARRGPWHGPRRARRGPWRGLRGARRRPWRCPRGAHRSMADASGRGWARRRDVAEGARRRHAAGLHRGVAEARERP